MNRMIAWACSAMLASLPTFGVAAGAQEAAATAKADPQPAAAPSRRVEPTNQAKWARKILHVMSAAASGDALEGTVALRVTVTAEGRAADCVVTGSSGHAVLDNAACSGLIAHARFTPALDQNGEAVPAPWSTRITYSRQ